MSAWSSVLQVTTITEAATVCLATRNAPAATEQAPPIVCPVRAAIISMASNALPLAPLAPRSQAPPATITARMDNSRPPLAPVAAQVSIHLNVDCDSACTTCTGSAATNCVTCANNNYLDLDSKTCAATCPSGKYYDSSAGVCLGKSSIILQTVLKTVPPVIQ